MKFEVCQESNIWEVGFFKDKSRQQWVCLSGHSSQAEADAERLRLIGGNTPPVRRLDESEE